MHFSTLVFTLSLSLNVGAFSPVDKDTANEFFGGEDACIEALTADLKCDRYVTELGETGWQGMIEDDEDYTLTDSICSKICHESLHQWSSKVQKNCKERIRQVETMLDGWRQLCDKDIAGRYCNEVIDGFPEVEDGEDWPLKYLCEPCYVRRLWMFDLSKYSPAQGHFLDQRERVLKGCPETAKAGISKVAVKAEVSETAKPEMWEVAHTASASETKTTAASESITTPTTTAAAESTTTAVAASNSAEKLGRGYFFGGLIFILGVIV
ncbi:hypothetical protein F53441_10740 [Fusarium austroafricanum]|uniref:Uncharacterized protein n=1 Tax=Fusarium austroafricanum TaxID=2364996 RepID=A0A8H4K893_9HYPO|nr:hypothetical protein F53441_10740 [Fusarium austroafricanum]